MIKSGLNQFSGKNVLLLQGPIGPFFKRFSSDLKNAGANVYKINFNGGDWLFYRTHSTNFNGDITKWPAYFKEYVIRFKIDIVFLFGDCRPLHKLAHIVATDLGLDIGVFEEGYIRPDYITLERYGTNGNSTIPKFSQYYAELTDSSKNEHVHVGKTFWFAAMWGMIYNTATTLAKPYFRTCYHHKSLSIWQGLFWIRSLYRKGIFAYQQKNKLHELTTILDKQYFLVPLQVHNDAQIHFHSDFLNVDAFISEVINSFAMHANPDSHLVIKHHPLDRGFNHYGELINIICQNQVYKNRVHYVHDLHLPTLLNHAQGVIVINSTVGLSALVHGCPVIVQGNAIYDLEGLTYQEALGRFWLEASTFKLDKKLLNKFIHYVVDNSQINGSFYKRIKNTHNNSGVFWEQTRVVWEENIAHIEGEYILDATLLK